MGRKAYLEPFFRYLGSCFFTVIYSIGNRAFIVGGYPVLVENRVNKMMAMAGAAWGLLGAAAVSSVIPASASFSPPARPENVFDSRPQAPVRPEGVLVPTELRPESPLPYADSALLGDWASEPREMAEEPPRDEVPPPELARVDATPPEAPVERRDFRALTSFDGTMEMTSGGGEVSEQPSRRPFPPPPARWNNPIRWLSTHHD
ncbi:MAG: hypothetical protein COV48_12625 [Elusimicrobia bacterium CG11_big_fil_rev_8_21_14_0_20_64_6]|nr:MAG: hypothetical protein COV48_12625 [Elusimicrobia bacterium CG11_big_fil_rev_8_21_14_0_20_64_6]